MEAEAVKGSLGLGFGLGFGLGYYLRFGFVYGIGYGLGLGLVIKTIPLSRYPLARKEIIFGG